MDRDENAAVNILKKGLMIMGREPASTWRKALPFRELQVSFNETGNYNHRRGGSLRHTKVLFQPRLVELQPDLRPAKWRFHAFLMDDAEVDQEIFSP